MSFGWLDRLRRAFAFRLALWYALVFVASTLGLFALTYQSLALSLTRRDHDLVRSTLREYASQYEAGGPAALRRVLDARQAAGADADLFVRILGSDRDTVFLSLPHGWAELATAPLDPTLDAGILQWSELPGRSPVAPLEVASLRLADGALFQVGRSAQSRVEILARFREVLGGMLALTLLVGLTGGVLFTASALKPLRELTHVVGGIVRTGRLSDRVPVRRSGDPLDEVAGLVNKLLERIEALVGAMRESLDNVAHDLRTPLTRLQVVLEQALQADDAGKARDAVADALEETERVTGTLDALMDVSEAEAGAMRLDFEIVNVAEALEDVRELYADVAEDKGITLTRVCPEDLLVRADRRRLRQVFANLVDNAVKYTHGGGRVDVSGRREGADVVVTVADDGPGIRSEDHERIWERLYRADRSRSERGLGLGLSLVRAIVHAHDGTVALESTPGRGARFSVRLAAVVS